MQKQKDSAQAEPQRYLKKSAWTIIICQNQKHELQNSNSIESGKLQFSLSLGMRKEKTIKKTGLKKAGQLP